MLVGGYIFRVLQAEEQSNKKMTQTSNPALYDLDNFTLKEMTQCGAALRQMGNGASCMEEVARRIVGYLFDNLGSKSAGDRSCALVRFFKTHLFESLEDVLKEHVVERLGEKPKPGTRCLTLLGTAGSEPQWRDRRQSSNHQAIPLVSPEMVAQSPMISQLVVQLGLEVSTVLSPDRSVLVDIEQKAYNVFYVPEALGNPTIPAQREFVVAHGIQSVLGFGGLLPSGDLFAVIVFSRVSIPKQTALAFKPFALNTKLAILPFDGGNVFIPS